MTGALDASAVLALLFDEPGATKVRDFAPGGAVSAVNWAEVVQALNARGRDARDVRAELEQIGLRIREFEVSDAEKTALLLSVTRSAGLSLADRACLALARRLGVPAVTADRAWTRVDAGAEVVCIR